jgi:HupE / UreJ protein
MFISLRPRPAIPLWRARGLNASAGVGLKTRLCATAVLLAALFWALSATLGAHDVPADITVQVFVKPEGQQLRLLLRVPLGAIVDVQLPLRGPGYLDFTRTDAWLPTVASRWMDDYAHVYEGNRRLTGPRIAAVRISLPSDKSFGTYEAALAHVATDPPLSNETELIWNQGLLDVVYEYPIRSDQSDFSVEPVLGRLGIKATSVIRFLSPGGVVRAFEFVGDPGLVRLDPRWFQAALRFVHLGFVQIPDGIDHLLFLFCLVIPFRRLRTLILVVTAFTVAHSITLISSAYELVPNALWFPPLIETLMATSIVYMALENIVSVRLPRRWLIAFGFGLVHGFGFSFALRETQQFAGSHLLTALLSFNVGVELGQVFVLLLMVPALNLLFRFGVAERTGTVILSALAAHTGWHWLLQRGDQLRQFRIVWPTLTAAVLASAIRWLMLILIIAAVAWVVFGLLRQAIDRSAAEVAPRADDGTQSLEPGA